MVYHVVKYPTYERYKTTLVRVLIALAFINTASLCFEDVAGYVANWQQRLALRMIASVILVGTALGASALIHRAGWHWKIGGLVLCGIVVFEGLVLLLSFQF